jgi:hypothetical protein
MSVAVTATCARNLSTAQFESANQRISESANQLRSRATRRPSPGRRRREPHSLTHSLTHHSIFLVVGVSCAKRKVMIMKHTITQNTNGR